MALDEEPENVIVPGQGLRRVIPLSMVSAIGFSGSVANGLFVDPAKKVAYYPLGSSVVVWPFGGGQKEFLTGHTYLIGSIDLSNSGRYLATGETDVVGTKVQVIIWDTASLRPAGSHLLHHASVAAIGISPNDRYVASAGGQDDPTILIWDIVAQAPVCVCKKTYDRPFVATKLLFTPCFDHIFMVGGQDAVHIWKLNEETKKATSSIIPLGKIKRTISDMVVCNAGSTADYLFCATRSGDIVKLYVDFLADDGSKTASVVAIAVKKASAKKGVNAAKFTGGVTSLLTLKRDEFLVGSGDGNVCLVVDQTTKPSRFKKPVHDGIPKQITEPTKNCLTEVKSKQFPGAVTSLARINDRIVMVGCDNGSIFQLDILTFDDALLSTCHTGAIFDIAFPHGVDKVFGSCGEDGIRIWSDIDQQVLHIPGPPHAQTNCILFAKDGKSILSGWSDGCLRSHTPQSGKLMYSIQGAHVKGVTSIALLRQSLMTGGKDGQIRTWRVNFFNPSSKPKLLTTIKEHTGAVVCLRVSNDEMEAISASSDGSCIIWNISNLEDPIRRQILTATSALCWAHIHPSQCQILTLATDGQVSYWEAVDGTEIRAIVLGKHSTVTSLDVDPKGEFFITSTHDSMVKVWKYKQGSLIAHGKARSGPITKTMYSPTGRYVVAITQHGAILIWHNYSEI